MTLAKIAEIAKPIDSEIYDIISKKFYLDDLLLSLPTAEKAIDIMPKINNLLRLFNLNPIPCGGVRSDPPPVFGLWQKNYLFD